MPSSKNKMSTKELHECRAFLMSRRAVLVGDMTGMNTTMRKTMSVAAGDLSTVPYHMADVGTDNFEHEFTLGLIENEEEELREIDAALERLEWMRGAAAGSGVAGLRVTGSDGFPRPSCILCRAWCRG